jgi:hypothetical protein
MQHTSATFNGRYTRRQVDQVHARVAETLPEIHHFIDDYSSAKIVMFCVSNTDNIFAKI